MNLALQAVPWPRLWQGRAGFVVLHTGGNAQALVDLLGVWRRWQGDPGRSRQLWLVWLCADAAQADAGLHAVAAPAEPEDAERLGRVRACWPPLTPNLHPLDLQPGQVQLLLSVGPLLQALPRLRLLANVLCLQGIGHLPPLQQLRALKALARLSTPGALACGTAAEPGLLAALRTAGYQTDGFQTDGFQTDGFQTHGVQTDAPGTDALGTDAPGPQGQVWTRYRPHARRERAARAGAPDPADAASVLPVPPAQAAPRPQTALVVGAGLAGAAAAQALARQGLAVTVLDRRAQPASETSGNAGALFHGTVNPDDGPYARLFRAAALVAQRDYALACGGNAGTAPVAGAVNGLLRLQAQQAEGKPSGPSLAQMGLQLQRLALPADYVQAVDAAQASQLAGRPLPGAAWFFPGGGWIDPAAWARQALQTPGVRFQGDTHVHAIRRQAGNWQVLDAHGQVLAQAQVLVLACAVSCLALLPQQAQALRWPLRQTRGQVTQLRVPAAAAGGGTAAALRRAVTGDGYALPLPAADAVLCGASRHPEVLHDPEGPYPTPAQPAADETTAEATVTAPGPPDRHHDQLHDHHHDQQQDHQHNLQRLQRLTGLQPAPGSTLLGRVGWRLHGDDRLPIAGPVPEVSGVEGERGSNTWPVHLHQARRWPRSPGLFVLTALGARGATLAPLLGRLVAAQATDAPWPLEQDLADAVDPARWALRAARSPSDDQSGPLGR